LPDLACTIAEEITAYRTRLTNALACDALEGIDALATALRDTWSAGGTVFLCGNGGSAANALHLANDWALASRRAPVGMKVEALSANPAVVTTIGNDFGYDQIFAEQIRVKGCPTDLLLVLSGSGNSPNVVRALEAAAAKGMNTFAIVGYSGGACRAAARHCLHFPIDDMQIAEDLQLVVGHICMRWLACHPPQVTTA
jgi:D-sedoheptulose 7-phosphate isomerase